MDFTDILILSAIEGISEFLPVSSTGHLILASHLLDLSQSEFLKSFEIIIQLGAILSVVILYGKLLLKNVRLWFYLVLGFIPSAIVGLLLYDFIKESLFSNPAIPVFTLFTGGALLLFIERFIKPGKTEISGLTAKKVMAIGIFQTLSVVPGVSRSAATIVGGMFTGLDKKSAAEFSFLLAIPTMIGAAGLDIIESELAYDSNELLMLAAGFILSFLFALLAVKFLIRFLEKNSLAAFGVYRIILAVLYYFLFLS